MFAVGADGALTNVDNVTDNATSNIQGPQGLATATVGGNAYLFVTGFHDDGVGVYSVAADGHLTNVFNVRDTGPMELDGPVDAITAVVGGTTYLFVSGFEDDGLTVFSVAADGSLANVFNLPDDGTLKLDNPVGLSTAVLNGKTYLFVAGADDDGLSVFAVGNDGALTNVKNVSDDATLLLDRVIGVTTIVVAGQTYVIAASNNDSGVSVFKFTDDTNHEPTLTAAGNDPAFTEGGAAADLFGTPLASTADPGQSFTSLTLTVTNVTDGASEILSFLGHELALTNGNAVAGVTVSITGTIATVTFPGAADAAALQALIDSLAYRNASENPTEADRVVTITRLSDSGGTAGGGDDTATLDIVSIVHVGRTNDAAIISGDTAGDVTEAGIDNGTPAATGDLDSADADNTADAWQAVAAGAATTHGFGTFALTANGVWTYTLDNANAAVQALNDGDTLTDTFTVLTQDGTAQLVTVTIHGQNDAAVITGFTTGVVTEAGVAGGTFAVGDMQASDVDNANDAWQAVAAGTASANGYGTFELTANGVWAFRLDNTNAAVQALNNGDMLTDAFTVLTQDGTSQLVKITIRGQNDAATITGDAAGAVSADVATDTGDLNAADPDNTNDAWQAVAAGAATAHGYGTFALTANGVWTYTLDNGNAAVQALNDGDTLTDTFSVLTADGTAQLVTVTINGANDAATITGDAAGAVSAGVAADTGDLNAADPDNTNDAWQEVAAGAATVHGYGTFALTADGHWTYTLDNANAAVQALNDGDTLTDTFTVLTADGTAQLVTVTISGANDAATITGDAAGLVSAGVATDTGDLNAADPDNTNDTWQAVAAGAATAHGYGTFALTADGHWTYTLDKGNAAVQALNDGDTLTDTFTVLTADGTAQLVTVTINGQNDAATITGDAAGAVSAAGNQTDTGDLNAADPDNAADTWQAVAAGAATAHGYGTYALTANGVWTYTLDGNNAAVQALHAGDTLTDTFTVLTADGTAQLVTVTINGANDAPPIDPNDAPVNTVPGTQVLEVNHTLAIAGLAVADPDAGAAAITTSLSVAHGILTVAAIGGVAVAGSGTSTVTLTGSVAQINAALGAAGNVVYAPAQGFAGADTLTMTTNDNGHSGDGGSLADTDAVAITVNSADHPNAPVIGTPGDDSFTALPGDQRIDALTGIDTITFDFKLVEASVSHVGNTVVIDGPNGHTVLTGIERFVFTDGTVDNHDGDVLVDDLFYYAQNHDVWTSHADADAHYHQFGRHEGRDPNAFFSTSTYLAINPAVEASGVDPLVQFDQGGWKTALSIGFDVNAYLSANPDVAAAGVDPLAHFLGNGAQEGRQPFVPSVLLAANGFDYKYYLEHNPDVAAAHVDPFQHFETIGWKEGRNPNALFDTNQYLAAYADVKAAGINPLDHYNEFGWHEGRDPSGGFDTNAYLSHNPDVAASQINPLSHFLQFGQAEARSPFADGHFG